MALNEENRIGVWGTLGEASKLAWELRLPFVVLTLLFALPNEALKMSGVMESLDAFGQQAKGGSPDLGVFPLSDALIALVVGFVVVSAFAIFWYRYLLLGREGALKFGFAELNGMVARFTGYGLLVMGVGLVAFTLATLLACALSFMFHVMLGDEHGGLAFLLYVPIFFLAYVVPLNFAARSALIFPAIAVGRDAALADVWAASKTSGAALVWAILIAWLPLSLLSYAIHSVIGAALGVDLLANSATTAQAYWWLSLALSPIGNAGLALMLAVVAVAYRDLMGREEAAEAARERFAY